MFDALIWQINLILSADFNTYMTGRFVDDSTVVAYFLGQQGDFFFYFYYYYYYYYFYF